MNKLMMISILFFSFLAHAEVTVIANDNVTLTQAEVVDVFSGEKTTAGGTKFTLADNKGAMEEFAQKVMKMDSGKYSSHWAKKAFRDGVPAPKSKSNDSEAADFVKSTPGGLSYISGAAPAGVKVIGKF